MPILYCCLTVLPLILFFWYGSLLLFVWRQARLFKQNQNEKEYLEGLTEKQKQCKGKRKKNYLLYLMILTLKGQGREKEARQMLPFLRSDPLLGIKKEAM